MKTVLISISIFVIIFGGAIVGMLVRRILPDYHLSEESRDFVTTLGIELAGVMAVLVLALMITGAQESFKDQRNEIIAMSSQIVLLHRLLTDYGPETAEARTLLYRSVKYGTDILWHGGGGEAADQEPDVNANLAIYNEIISLKPDGQMRDSIRAKALELILGIQQTFDLLNMQQIRNFPRTSIIILSLLVFWFFCIFFGLGIYAPSNATVMFVLVLSALSVAIAFFLIIDLHLTFEGLLRVPSEPLEEALYYIGK